MHSQQQSGERAREQWILSLDRQFLSLRQEAIVVPAEFNTVSDEIEREVALDGYISGYDWIVSAAFFHKPPVETPGAIAGDDRLTALWAHAYESGCSNGLARMDAHFGESYDSSGTLAGSDSASAR